MLKAQGKGKKSIFFNNQSSIAVGQESITNPVSGTGFYCFLTIFIDMDECLVAF
jgi:hypothetical protein